MSNPQETEFTTFGIVNKTLRGGILVGLLILSITGNIILTSLLVKMQSDLYSKMLSRADDAARNQADKSLKEPIKKLNQVTTKADTVLDETRNAAKAAKNAGDSILNQHKNK